MGRRRLYASDAERQRAYRERKRNTGSRNIVQPRVTLTTLAHMQGISPSYLRLAKRVLSLRPDLRDQVTAGGLSLSRAAVDLGLRARRASIPTNDAARAVAILRKHYTTDQVIAALIERGDLDDILDD